MRRSQRTRISAIGIVLAATAAGCDAGPPPPQGGLVITKGGTYSGEWFSDDPDQPVVVVRTAEPVVIERGTLRGRGTLIAVVAEHADVTVRDCRGTGLNPGVAGRAPGRFLSAESFDRVVVEHCELTHTAGIYLLANAGRSPGAVRIVANRATNIDGRRSDGRGGWLPFNDRKSTRDGHAEQGHSLVQFLQLDKVRGIPGMEVGWNEVVNEPGQSRVEDNVNVYESRGTPASPLLIHDNYVQGGYTVAPAWAERTSDGDWTYDWDYNGGGILLGDGPAETAETSSAFVRATGNVVVGTVNYGIAIAAGHDISFDHNRIVSSGLLPDGRRAAGQNVGAYIWDGGHGKRRGSFFANGGTDNVVGWASAKGGRNDSWMPDAAEWAGTVALPDPVTPADEAREHADWLTGAARAGVTIGPTVRP